MAVTASLHIETALRNGRTYLKRSFASHPFKLANVTEGSGEDGLRLMLRSSSPGVLDGDTYHIKIDVAENSSLCLETQSYQRLFQMKTGASQQMDVSLADGASLYFIPHPVVPHAGSVFSAVATITLGRDCRLLWAEVIACGRKLNGEVFLFTSFQSLTKIYYGSRLAVKENLWLQPLKNAVTGLGQLEGFTHQSSLLFIAEKINVPNLQQAITEALSPVAGIVFGVSCLPLNGLVLRMMGHSAEVLFTQQKAVAALIQSHCTAAAKQVTYAG